jgi:hypothetical protein
MKSKISILLTCIFIAFSFSCEKETGKTQEMSGKLISYSDCKSLKFSDPWADTPDSLSCVEYSFNSSDSILYLKHINAGFNCCPNGIYCNISISNDTITIHELENASACNCNCLYDLNIEINGVTLKKYQLKFIEPYAGEQQKLFFEIDLIHGTTGSYCVSRYQYPWAIN